MIETVNGKMGETFILATVEAGRRDFYVDYLSVKYCRDYSGDFLVIILVCVLAVQWLMLMGWSNERQPPI